MLCQLQVALRRHATAHPFDSITMGKHRGRSSASTGSTAVTITVDNQKNPCITHGLFFMPAGCALMRPLSGVCLFFKIMVD